MDTKSIIIEDFVRGLSFVVLYFCIFIIAKIAKGICTSYKINDQLVLEDNLAIAISISGYYLATAAIFVGALYGPSQNLITDLLLVAQYSVLGVLFLNAARWFNDKAILPHFCDTAEMVQEKNIGVAIVHFGAYVATGIIAAASVSGQNGNFITATVFFILGQTSLFLFSLIYEKIAIYSVHEELKSKNIASGVAFAGHLIALSIIVMNAAAGDFVNWQEDLTFFAIANIKAFIFLPIIGLVMDRLVVPGHSLAREIKEDRNIGAGLLEATVAISFAVILTRVL